MIRRYNYRGCHRRRPAKGSPLTLSEIFGWTVIAVGYLMVGILGVAYAAQSNDPGQVEHVCVTGTYCAPDIASDTISTSGATP